MSDVNDSDPNHHGNAKPVRPLTPDNIGGTKNAKGDEGDIVNDETNHSAGTEVKEGIVVKSGKDFLGDLFPVRE